MNSITRFAIRSPLVIGSIAIALAAFGLYSYFTLGVAITPTISFPTVTVTTTYSGANPDTVETQVTDPIENAIATLSNIDTLTSTSVQGQSTVRVQFTTAANSQLIGVDVERVVNSARANLPSGAGTPTVSTASSGSISIMTLAVSGTQPLDQIDYVAENQVQRAIEAVSGVNAVSVVGAPTRQIFVKADLNKLQARSLGLTSLQTAIQSAQLEQPGGTILSNTKDADVVLSGLVATPEQLGNIVVAQTSSGPVYVKDVATIDDSQAKQSSIARVNGTQAITLTVTKQESASTINVSGDVRAAVSQLQLPQGMHVTVVTDAANYTQQSFDTIRKTLIEAVLLTGLILMMFLHTWRSTLIVMISIPTSVLTTLGLMDLLGLNLNLFTMLALTLSIGILVDDSIVVIENIARHLGMHQPPVLAALRGRSEISMAAITITFLDIVVWVPIAMISGIAGQLLRPFAIVIAAATLTSLVVSFTLTPLLASRYLSIEEAIKAGGGPLDRFGRWWDSGFNRVETGYAHVLHGVLTRRWWHFSARWLVIALGIASFIGGLGLLGLGRIGVDIFPSGDQSEVYVTLKMPSATDIDVTDSVSKTIEQRLRQYPEVTSVYASVGAGSSFGSTGGNQAQLTVDLVQPDRRKQSAQQLADTFRQQLGQGIADLTVQTSTPNSFGFGGFGNQAIQMSVQGSDPTVLNNLVGQVTGIIESTPGAVNVSSDLTNTTPRYTINLDQSKAAQLGVSTQSAGSALAAAVNGTKVAAFQQTGETNIDIQLIADDQFRASASNLSALPLLTSNGTIVSLGQIGTIAQSNAQTSISHTSRLRSVSVNADAGNGYSIGAVQGSIQRRLATLSLPSGYTIGYAGQAQQSNQAFGTIFQALGVSLLLMYALMMLLFESLTLPLAVLMSLPLAVVGALGAMTITATNFTLFSMLGVALLMGLVGKNAVLLVDFTDRMRKQGMTRADALLHAGPTRLRPILMTTASVIVALAPIAFGLEAGSDLLKAAAIVLVGGLVTSTVLTLVFVPAMYTIFDDIQNAFARVAHRFAGPPRKLHPVEEAILHPPRTEDFEIGPTVVASSTDGRYSSTAAD